ncbi:MAG: glycosyltransferase family 39 protein [Verrucomicrobiales bacterium]|nr:glycosyltransferase family 39 protein [Verrucomicrobiales bacterium]
MNPSSNLAPPATATALRSERTTAFLVPLLLVALLFALRILGPSNLTDNDQERPAAYILDAVKNGHWIIQKDWLGDIASKPPLYTWWSGLTSMLVGRVNLATLYLPCALAMAGTALLVAWTAGAALGPRGALVAALFFVANPLTAKLVALARTDAVFTLGVALTATLAGRAALTGRGWVPAWIAAAAATLTKGPLGLVLGFAGLLSLFWDRPAHRRWHGGATQFVGAGIFVFLTAGWFFLAWRDLGDPLIQKMIRSELVNHAIQASENSRLLGFALTPAYFMGRFVPWSLLTLVGIVHALRHPPADPTVRRMQRYALAWLVTGLLVFGAASHQRGDLVAPLMPAGALLAAIPVARWTQRWTFRRLALVSGFLGLLLALGFQWDHTRRRRDAFAESQGCELMARDLLRLGDRYQPTVHVDAPFALQFHLGTMHFAVSPERAAALLRSGAAKSAAVSDRDALTAALGSDATRLRVLAQWPDSPAPRLQIVALEPAP